MPLGKEVGLGPGHIVLDGDTVGTQPPQQPLPTFSPCLTANGRPSQQLLSSCYAVLPTAYLSEIKTDQVGKVHCVSKKFPPFNCQ